MNRLFALALALFVSALACVSAPHARTEFTRGTPPVGVIPKITPVWIDVDFTPSETSDLRAAFGAWNESLNGYLEFVVVTDDFAFETSIIEQVSYTGQGILVLRHTSEESIVSEIGEGVLGWTPDAPANEVNIVADAIGTRNLQMIAMHEIGHALGLEHVMVKNTLMFPSYSYGSKCIDRITVQTLATIRGWDWHNMSYCNWPLYRAESDGPFPANDVRIFGRHVDRAGALVVRPGNG